MSEIIGTVISGGRGMADFPGLYQGAVGLRHRGGFTEAAFPVTTAVPRLSDGPATLDGMVVEIVGIERSTTDPRMMVATLCMIDQPGS